MYEAIVISGFGGQGVLFAGQLLAYAGAAEGRHVTWIPSYGPEMRGGTAHCTVIVSDEEIGSPVVLHPTAALVLNRPSLEKYAPLVQPGGVLVRDSTHLPDGSGRSDLREIALPAQAIAAELGFPQIANVVLVGAYVGATGLVRLETVERVLEERLSERQPQVLAANREALRRGASAARASARPVG